MRYRSIEMPEILVSPQDEWLLENFSWYLSGNGYIRRGIYLGGGKTKIEYLHRIIMKPPSGMTVDHLNGNKADNRRENLRVCSHRENVYGKRKMSPRNKSGYLGVHRQKAKWRAMIRVQGKPHSLGLFHDPKDAAIAYDKAARMYFGQFASTNF